MPYTSHGHPYGVIDTDAPSPPVTRCGGPRLCKKCGAEAYAETPVETDVPIIARYGSLEAVIGSLRLHKDRDPIVTVDPGRVRLAQAAIRAIAGGPQ